MGVGYLTGQGGGGSNIKSIQGGTFNYFGTGAGDTQSDMTVNTVNANNCLLLLSIVGYSNPQNSCVNGTVYNNYIRLKKYLGYDSPTVQWQLIEFNNVKSRQSGFVTQLMTISINEINLGKSIAYSTILNSASNEQSAWSSGFSNSIKLTSPTSLNIDGATYLSNTREVAWQVIEFK